MVFRREQSHLKHFNFLKILLLPFVNGVWVVCNHLLSLDDGVQSLSAAVRAAQWLSAKCLKQGMGQHHNNYSSVCSSRRVIPQF